MDPKIAVNPSITGRIPFNELESPSSATNKMTVKAAFAILGLRSFPSTGRSLGQPILDLEEGRDCDILKIHPSALKPSEIAIIEK